ncbi:MAG: hypothetical protein ACTSWW_07510, partial [Promethearchaeota archaeon]
DLRTEGGQEIEADQKAYYENLAKELLDLEDADQGECMICSKPVCDYCQDPTDLRKCPNCGGILHSCCAALYSWKYNIGMKNIFRCVSCEALIKMDESLVYEINGESLPSAGIMTPEELEEQMAEEETWSPTAEEPDEEKPEPEPEPESEEPPVMKEIPAPKTTTQDNGKFEVTHGMFGPTYKKKSSQKSTKETTQHVEDKPEDKAAKPPVKKSSVARSRLADRRKRAARNGSVRICKVCANRLKQNERICPKCGSPAF